MRVQHEGRLEPGMTTDLYEVDLEVLDDAICWRLVGRAAFGRIAFFHADELHVLPVNAAVKERKVIFRVLDGSLIATEGHGATVAFESDEIDPSTESGWSVLDSRFAVGCHRHGGGQGLGRVDSAELGSWTTRSMDVRRAGWARDGSNAEPASRPQWPR